MNNKNINKLIKNPSFLFFALSSRGLFNWINDEQYLKIAYRIAIGRKLNLKEPKTFNEKLQWLKLYDRNPEYAIMVDKYECKKYVEKRIGKEYIIPTLGVWNNYEEIDFDKLPKQFVLKCTHDSGGIIIVRDKSQFEKKKVEKKIKKCLNKNFFYGGREWPYKNVKPRIIAEQYMENTREYIEQHRNSNFINDNSVNGLIDYKFYCFNGEPRFLYISQGLENHNTACISFVSLEWKKMPFYRKDYREFVELPPKPLHLDQMIDICKVLSQGLKFVRIDLYEINEKVYFSEITLHPCSGFMPFNSVKYDKEVGDLLVL